MDDSPESRNRLLRVLGATVLLGGLYVVSLDNYPLFHTIAELFSVVVMFSIFTIAWNSRQLLDNNYLMFLGTACLFIGSLDVLHTLAYRGMGVFQAGGGNLSTQLWIAARSLHSVSLLLAPLFLHRRLNLPSVFLSYGAALALLLLAVFRGVFPVCYIEGVGLTLFKIASEYVICALFGLAIVALLRQRRAFDSRVVWLLVGSLTLSILSELAFTLYADVFAFFNTVGHYLKIASFYLIYRAVVVTGIARPQQVLFRRLTQSEEAVRRARDHLEEEVRERTKELTRSEAQSRSMARFLRCSPLFGQQTGLDKRVSPSGGCWNARSP